MSNEKRYRLLKDLPGVKSGTIYRQHPNYDNRYYPENCYENNLLIFDTVSIYGLLSSDVKDVSFFEAEHNCPHCGALTFQSNDQCYKAPSDPTNKSHSEQVYREQKKADEVKAYEILSYERGGKEFKQEDILYVYRPPVGSNGVAESFTSYGAWEAGLRIYSVRRKSDNQMFTVGDGVRYVGLGNNITGFQLYTGSLCAKITPFSTEINAIAPINDIEKMEPQHTEPQKSCHLCGGEMVLIRGKYPKMPMRMICPCCTYERLEQIEEIADPHYGKVCKSSEKE